MTRRRRRVLLALGALAAAAAHCAALSAPSGRRLITFDEAHNALTDTVTEVANEAVDTANNIVSALASTVLGGVTRTDGESTTGSPSTSISVSIGGASTSDADDQVAEKHTSITSEEGESFSDEEDNSSTPTGIADSVTTMTPSTVSVSVTGSREKETSTPTATRRSGLSHAISMTKRPTTYTPSTDDETGAESIDTDNATPTVAPAPTTKTPTTHAPVVSVSTEAPVVPVPTPTSVTIVITTPTPVAAPVATDAPAAAPVSTDAPVVARVATDAPVLAPEATDAPVVATVATEIPVTVLPTTAPPATETPVVADTPILPTTQSSSVSGVTPGSGVLDDETDAPAVTGSTSADVAVTMPDESTVVPIANTGAPAAETGSAEAATPSAGVPASPESPATWRDSSGSSSSNETVTYSASGSEENSDGTSPGQVHASSSADVSLEGSDALDIESSNSSHGGKQKKDKKKKETHSSSGDFSAGSSNSSGKGGSSMQSSTSNSRDGSSGMGALLNPGGVSDVNTSSATYYSLGTGSIVAIVGVIAGIMGVLVLFVAISRKKYTDDDGESPLPYGYNMDIRTLPRLSPTFMQDDSFMESGYNGTALMVAMPPQQFDGASSTSGESADEVPSLRGNMMAANHCDPLADISIRSRVPSVQSFSGDLDTGNVRVSALYSAGSSMTSGSAISGSWSSVLASDTERQTSRNTRDTTLSGWSATNLSSFGSTASGASGLSRMTRSSSAFSALSGDLRQTGGSDRSRSSSRLSSQPEAPRVAAGPVDSNRSDKSTEI